MAKAVLGGEVEVPALDGKLMMKIPAGTQCGKTFRLKGKGLPDLHSREIGDELVKVDIEIPARLTSQQKQLIEEFARLNGESLGSKESFTDKLKKTFR
jgi:molecular chaperone DnaJ